MTTCEYPACEAEAIVIVRRFYFASHPMCLLHGLRTANYDLTTGVESFLLDIPTKPTTGDASHGS